MKINMLKLLFFVTASNYVQTILSMKESKDTMLRDCNLNTEDYKRILHSDCFVDKSLLINKFMTSETPVILVTAPRRFGKTINLNMLKTFLKIGEDETPDLTRDCSVLKKYNLNIYNYDNNSFFETHCGKYPIIHVTFKQLTGSNFKGILDGFKPILRGTFLEHDYLLKSSFLRGHEKDRIQLYTDKITYEKLTNRQILKGLKFLSHMLYLNFDKNVIVLIDDYDVLVKKLLEEKFPKKDIRKTVKFFTSFTSILLENNQFMDRALINSCLTLSTLLSANIQNIFHYPFLVQHDLVKYYGLTSKEVKQKLVQFNIIDKYHSLKEYYNGYKTDSGLNIYNTWSVLNYMQYEVLSNYWVNMTGLKEFFLKGIVRKWVTEVLNSGNVTIKTAKMSFNDIFILKDIMLNRVALKRNEAVVFIEFLTDNGYFIQTIEDPKEVCLKIPNEEIRQHIFKVINGEM